MYIKSLLKPQNTYNKPFFETACFGKNGINLLQQKVAPKVTISLVCFMYSKNHKEPPKVAQLVKNRPIWSPWSRLNLELSKSFSSTNPPLTAGKNKIKSVRPYQVFLNHNIR